MFYDRSFLRRSFGVYVLPVLEYCSAVWCSPADTRLKLLDRVVSGARFQTGGVFEFDIAHRRSVAVLFILSKIRCNTMHSLYGALPVPYVPVRVILVYLCASSVQNLLVPSQCLRGTIKSRANAYLLT